MFEFKQDFETHAIPYVPFVQKNICKKKKKNKDGSPLKKKEFDRRISKFHQMNSKMVGEFVQYKNMLGYLESHFKKQAQTTNEKFENIMEVQRYQGIQLDKTKTEFKE